MVSYSRHNRRIGNSEQENRNKRVDTKPTMPQKLSLRNAAVSQTMYGPWDTKILQIGV